MSIKLKWSSLLHLTELDFEPEPPKTILVSDEMIQAISWLTAATKHDRRLLRCDENGALLIADAWSLLTSVETDELNVVSAAEDTFTATVPNKGVLIAPAVAIVRAIFTRVAGGDAETIYIPAGYEYWYPHTTYSVTCHVVPDPNGTTTYVGVTAFN